MPWIEITGLNDRKRRLRYISRRDLLPSEIQALRQYWEFVYTGRSRRKPMTKRAYGLAGFAICLLLVLIAQRSGWL